MCKRLRQVAVILSTVCFIASVVGWTSSYLARGLVVNRLHTTPPGEWRRPYWWCVGTIDGRVVGIRMEARWQTNRGDECQSMADQMLRDAWRLVETNPSGLLELLRKNGEERWGFGLARMPVPKKYIDQSLVMLPWWTLCSITAIWPLRRLYVGARRRARLAAGLCGSCGYDLRHSHGRCPECGTAIGLARPSQMMPSDKPAHARVLMHFAEGLLLAGCIAFSVASITVWGISYSAAIGTVRSAVYWTVSEYRCCGVAEGRVFCAHGVMPNMGRGRLVQIGLDFPPSMRETARKTEAVCDRGRFLPGIRWCSRVVDSTDRSLMGGTTMYPGRGAAVTAFTVHLGWSLVPGAIAALVVARGWTRGRTAG